MKRVGLVLGIIGFITTACLIRANSESQEVPQAAVPIVLSTGEEVKRTVLRATGTGHFPEGEANEAKALLKARSSARRDALLRLAELVGFKPAPEVRNSSFRAELRGARVVEEKLDTENKTVTLTMEIALDTLLTNFVRRSAAPAPVQAEQSCQEGSGDTLPSPERSGGDGRPESKPGQNLRK